MAVAARELQPPVAAPQPLPDYGLFDVLRFLLSATVVLSHVGLLGWGKSGNLAVQCFFALSGWLIGGILCGTGPTGLPRFYFNRLTRIWIPYFICVAALYLTSYLHEPVRSPRWGEFLVYDVTFTHNWFSLWGNADAALRQMPLKGTGNHFWSLAVEEQFYLVCPLLMVLLPFGKRILPWLILALAAYWSNLWYGSVTLGVLAAVIAHQYPGWQLRTEARVGLVLLLGTASSVMVTMPGAYGLEAPLFAISLVLLCSIPTTRTRLVRWLGGISFPLYLNAWIGIFAIHAIEKKLHLPDWRLLELFAALVAGTACYLLIDAQVMARRSRYYRPVIGIACGAAGYALVLAGVLFFFGRHSPG